MDSIKNLIRLQETVDSFWLNGFIIICMILFVIGLTLIGLLIMNKDKSKNPVIQVFIAVFLFVGVIGMSLAAVVQQTTIIDLAKAEEVYFKSLEDSASKVKVDEIVHSMKVDDFYCPHVDTSDKGESCQFVKFLSDGKLKQVLISDAHIDKEAKNVTISIYKLSDTEHELIGEYIGLNDYEIRNDIDADMNEWLLGFKKK